MRLDTDATRPVFDLLSRRQRIYGTARGLILQWRDQPNLLWEIAMFGACQPYPTSLTPEQNFIRMMRAIQQHQDAVVEQGGVPSLNGPLSDADYGEIYEAIRHYVKVLEQKGAAFRQRKDSRVDAAYVKHFLTPKA